MKNTAPFLTAIVAVAAIASSLPGVVHAQDKMAPKKPPMAGKPMAGKMVYVCSQCKMYYSEADAKKMKMMDPMKHKLVATPMAKVPKGFKMGHAGGMMGHMDKMGGGKM